MINNESVEKLYGLLMQLKIHTRLRALADLVFMMETNDHLAVSLLKVLEEELKSITCDVNLIVTETKGDRR